MLIRPEESADRDIVLDVVRSAFAEEEDLVETGSGKGSGCGCA